MNLNNCGKLSKGAKLKRILLIGGGGYVGAELQKVCVDIGYDVRVLDTFWFPEGELKNLPFYHDKIEYMKGDIRNKLLLEKALKDVDYCIHLACISNDPSYELDPLLARSVNFESFELFLELLSKSSVERFIYASSSSVYGIKSEPEVTEELSCEPISDYSLYKVKCEQLIKEKLHDFPVWTIVRPSTVCGVSSRQRFDLVVNALTFSALRTKSIRIDGGEQYRPNLHIRDMTRAYEEILNADSNLINQQIFNIAGENLTVRSIGEKVRAGIDEQCILEFREIIDPRSYRVSGLKILNVLGFLPKFRVEDAINDIKVAYKNGLFEGQRLSNFYNLERMKELIDKQNL